MDVTDQARTRSGIGCHCMKFRRFYAFNLPTLIATNVSFGLRECGYFVRVKLSWLFMDRLPANLFDPQLIFQRKWRR